MNQKPAPAFQAGRVYVIEFWASWCGPCLAAFEHLNELTQTFKGQPVTFLAVTQDDPAKVARLLKTRSLSTQIAYDVKGKTFDTYGVRVIPHTVIVGANGKIAAITNPMAVTAQAVRATLAGQALRLPEKTNVAADLNWDKQSADAPEALTQVIVQRSNADSGASRFRPNSGRIVGDGLGLSSLIQLAYDAEFFEIKNTLPRDDKTRYRISVQAADGKDATARTLLASVLPTLTPFTAQWVEVEETVPVLQRIPGSAPLTPSQKKTDGFAQMGEMEYTGVPLKTITSTLAALVYGSTVVDETGYMGNHDMKLTWVTENTASLEAALKAYGLQVVRDKRKVRRLLVQPAE